MYTEHEKLKAIKDQSEAIGQFLEWQTSKDRDLCQFNSKHDDYLPLFHGSIEKILAEYFEIDLQKLEEEKRQMIEECRKLNEKN